jgi:hypothetical protein
LPRADGVSFDIEHRLSPRLDIQASVRQRVGSHLPTVIVPEGSGAMTLSSGGTSTYRELQLSVRRQWAGDAQTFVSYVRSSSEGDSNDFGTIYTSLTTPLVQPGALAPTPGDVPHRVRGWATFDLPRRIVVSPSLEWRTGFPYSTLRIDRTNAASPNDARFPSYFQVDVTVFKTFDVYGRMMDLGIQVFNATNHFNPRDVIPVRGSTRYGELTNSVGATLGGYMQVRWQ